MAFQTMHFVVDDPTKSDAGLSPRKSFSITEKANNHVWHRLDNDIWNLSVNLQFITSPCLTRALLVTIGKIAESEIMP